MSVATSTAIAIAGGLAAAGGVASSVIGSDAAGKASSQQVNQDNNALAETEREFNVAQGNSAPFVQAGQQSIGQIMTGLNNGTFGPGSVPAFQAPTLAEAQQTPGYQFTAQQGNKGILEGAAAAGGAISGGTLKSLDSFNTNLADSTYSSAYNRALSTYGANLAGQQQSFNQLLAPAQIGSGQASSINSTSASAASSIGQLMASLGASQAAGTVGSANAITGGLSSATNGISQSLLLGKLFGGGSGTVPGSGPGTNYAPYGTGPAPGETYNVPYDPSQVAG